MVMTRNGGTTWTPIPALDGLMTGGGTFLYNNQTGPRAFTNFQGYPQPTLVAFDPLDRDILVAGGADSGVFISTNGGTRWQLVTDPISPGTSGVPHIPRPYYAHFDHDAPGGDVQPLSGTRGRGAWRLTFAKVLMSEIQVPSPPAFNASCLGDNQRGTLRVCNTSGGDFVVSSITSSNPEFTIVRRRADSRSRSATTSASRSRSSSRRRRRDANDHSDHHRATIRTSRHSPSPSTASVGQPTAVTMIADTGNFGEFCPAPGKFKDLAVTIDNRGTCPAPHHRPHLVVSRVPGSAGADVPDQGRAGRQHRGAVPVPADVGGSEDGNADRVAPTIRPRRPRACPSPHRCRRVMCARRRSSLNRRAVGPTWGTGRTGNYTVNTSGHFLGSFGPERRFGAQVQGEYMFYPGRQEGQSTRRCSIGAASGRRRWAPASRTPTYDPRSSRALSQVTASFDVLLPTIRFGAFGSKGLKETDIAGLTERVGPIAPPGGQPIIAIERVLHTVDSLGGSVQLDLVPALWWLDANAAFLNRHAPGASNTAGAAVRVSRQILPWLVGMAQFDVNESFVGFERGGDRHRRPDDRALAEAIGLVEPGESARVVRAQAALRSIRSDSLIGPC